jgi:hypothetical protein
MLDEDEEVPFRLNRDGGGLEDMPDGPTVRKNVDAGVDVIDLTAMRASLEAERARKQGGG